MSSVDGTTGLCLRTTDRLRSALVCPVSEGLHEGLVIPLGLIGSIVGEIAYRPVQRNLPNPGDRLALTLRSKWSAHLTIMQGVSHLITFARHADIRESIRGAGPGEPATSWFVG